MKNKITKNIKSWFDFRNCVSNHKKRLVAVDSTYLKTTTRNFNFP